MNTQEKYLDIIKQGARIAGVLDLQEALVLIAESAAQLTSSEGAAILLYDESRKNLIFQVATGPGGGKIHDQRQSIDEGIAGRVLKAGEGYISNDAEQDIHHSRRMDIRTGYTTRSLIAVPMTIGKRKIGVLEVVNKQKGSYGESDLALLNSFAGISAAVLDNARKFQNLKHEHESLVTERKESRHRLIGKTIAIENIRKTIDKIAAKPVTVLISGESGTGKEVVAWQIHERSNRASHPFVKVSCAALNEGLLESELFGHEKGSFTGAQARHIGKFERARGGTIFLDEIGEISEGVQVKLLRVLQENEIERVGGSETIAVDARIISATNRDLKKSIQNGLFREDLFYRLNVMHIEIPPLRERKEDIPLLVEYILANLDFDHPLDTISDEAMDHLLSHSFPGNVRELENMLERAAVFATDNILRRELLPEAVVTSPTEIMTYNQIQRQGIIVALKKSRGNQTKAANLLGITRDRLRYRLKTLNINPRDFK